MKNSRKKERTLAWTEKIVKHPLLLLAGLAVAVVALIVTILLFFLSQTERELVYAVNPVKTRVVAMGQVTGLEIRHKGMELGNVDITAAQVAIWNSGDESIRSEDVLKEVIICTEPAVKILEVSVVKYSREFEVTKLSVAESSELLDIGKVPISWRILEKNDGASIQLIYLGSTDIDIYVEGLIEGSGEIKRAGAGVKIKTPAEQVKTEQQMRWFAFVMVPLILTAGVLITRDVIKTWRRKRKPRLFLVISSVPIILMFSMPIWVIVILIRTGPFGPPFGF